jgi:carbonic anhydrase/acetyltransferase-like protein (isoleucine patch superfamily)
LLRDKRVLPSFQHRCLVEAGAVLLGFTINWPTKPQEQEGMMAFEPRPTIVLPYGGEHPRFQRRPDLCAQRTAVLGRASVGGGLILGSRATIRADGNHIQAGEAFCLGPRSTVHISRKYPTLIGDRVAVAGNVVVHACTIGDDVAVEDDVVILDGAEIAGQTIIAKGSIVFPRACLEAGGLWAGLPARRQRALEPGEADAAVQRIRAQSFTIDGALPAGTDVQARLDACLFVAPTARIAGAVEAETRVSIWFGCEVDAQASSITIGARTNIQDNTEISCPSGPVAIGQDCVVGHNVRLESCTIDAGSLIGNGAFVQRGTIVEAGVLVAAGAVTEVGQRLESGWIWGGRPARRLSQLDATRLRTIAGTVEHYMQYAADFRATMTA